MNKSIWTFSFLLICSSLFGQFGPKVLMDDFTTLEDFTIGDFNGDGNTNIITGERALYNYDFSTEIIPVERLGPQVRKVFSLSLDGIESHGSIDEVGIHWHPFNSNTNSFESFTLSDGDFGKYIIDDINKDGNDDIIVISGSSPYTLSIFLYDLNSQAFIPSDVYPLDMLFTTLLEFSMITFDVDDDGENDILIPFREKMYWLKNIGGSLNFEMVEELPELELGTTTFIGIFKLDLDNDGKEDILVNTENNNSQSDIIRLETSLNDVGIFTPWKPISIPFGKDTKDLLFVDVNNDGYKDVLFTEDEFFGKLYAQINQKDRSFSDEVQVTSIAYNRSFQLWENNQNGRRDFFWMAGNNAIVTLENVNEIIDRNNMNSVGNVSDSEYIDLDGDGDLDKLAIISNRIVWFENYDGQGNFNPEILIASSNFSNVSFKTLDVDNDGDIDVLANGAFVNFQSTIYENDGSGFFSVSNFPLPNLWDQHYEQIAADFNGDGFVDLLAVNDGKIYIYLNDLPSQSSFQNAISVDVSQIDELNILELTEIDWDQDGDIDIMANDFNDVFFIEYDSQLSILKDPVHFVDNKYSRLKPVFFDLNKDGNNDFVYVNIEDNEDKIFFVRGTDDKLIVEDHEIVFFSTENDISLYGKPDLFIARDVNYDGAMDLLFNNYCFAGIPNTACFQNPYIYFKDGLDSGSSLHIVDVNGDGILDFASNNLWTPGAENFRNEFEPKTILRNISEFTSSEYNLGKVKFSDPIKNDIYSLRGGLMVFEHEADSDSLFKEGFYYYSPSFTTFGFDEGVLGNLVGGENPEIYFFKGFDLMYVELVAGVANISPRLISQNSVDRSLQIVDLDKDGREDLIACDNSDVVWYRNISDTYPYFEEQLLVTFVGNSIQKLTLFDIEGDGDLDIFHHGFGLNEIISFSLNDGNNSFGPLTEFVDDDFREFELVDLNNDNNVDIVYKTFSRIQVRYGGGASSPADIVDLYLGAGELFDFEIFDFDLDGRLDIIVSESNDTVQPMWLLTQSFDGNFELPIQLNENFEDESIREFVFDDIDIDGDQDLIFFAGEFNEAKLYYAENVSNNPKLEVSVYNDINENGSRDSSEYFLFGQELELLPSELFHFSDSSTSVFLLDEGDYEIVLSPSDSWTVTTGSNSFSFSIVDTTNTIEHEFGIAKLSDSLDLEIHTISAPTRCDTEVKFWITLMNNGTIPTSGVLRFDLDPNVEFVSFEFPPDSINGQTVFWNFDNFNPTQTQTLSFIAKIPNFQFTGDILDFEAEVSAWNDDIFPDSVFQTSSIYSPEVRCSYDPNDKLVFPAGEGAENYTLFDNELFYTVRFQNTGNDYALNVTIRDTLDENIDWSTFRPIGSSHPYSVERSFDGFLEFNFLNIFLPDSTSNEPESHGFVSFAIQPLPGLDENTIINNRAGIYFDFNPPVITNETKNTMVSMLPTSTNDPIDFDNNTIFSFYPNPIHSTLVVKTNQHIQDIYTLQFFDINGKQIEVFQLENSEKQLNLLDLTPGAYFYSIHSNEDELIIQRGKLIKL